MQERVPERFDLAGICVRSPRSGQWNFDDLVEKTWAVSTKAGNLNLSLVWAIGGRMDLLLNLLHADVRGRKCRGVRPTSGDGEAVFGGAAPGSALVESRLIDRSPAMMERSVGRLDLSLVLSTSADIFGFVLGSHC